MGTGIANVPIHTQGHFQVKNLIFSPLVVASVAGEGYAELAYNGESF